MRSSRPAPGILGVLADLSFTELLATRIIKFVYLLAVGLSALGAVTLVLTGLTVAFSGGGFGSVFLGLVVFPTLAILLFLFNVLMARIFSEMLIVVFRIAEYLRSIDRRLELGGDAAPDSGTAHPGL